MISMKQLGFSMRKMIFPLVIIIIIMIIMIVYSTFLQHKLNYKEGH